MSGRRRPGRRRGATNNVSDAESPKEETAAKSPCLLISENIRWTSDKDKNKDLITLLSCSKDSFRVPARILTANSEYFRGLLESGMKESQEREVCLPALSSVGIKYAAAFMEKGMITLSYEDYVSDIHDVVEAATYLQIRDLCQVCCASIKCYLENNENAVVHFNEMLSIAEKFDLQDVVEFFHKWAYDNGEQYLKSQSFLLKDIEDAVAFLSSDSLFVDSEELVFEAALTLAKQFEDDYKCTSMSLCSLLQSVRFAQMPEESILKCKEECKILQNPPKDILDMMDKAVEYHQKPECKHLHSKHLNLKPRCPVETLFTCGGFLASERSSKKLQLIETQTLQECTEEEPLQFKTNDRTKFPTTICEHSMCVLDNFVYVAGGQVTYCQDGKTTTNTVHCFNTILGTWSQVKSMHQTRSLFYMCVLNGKIYAVSGWLRPDTVTRSVEVYHPSQDVWTMEQSLEIGTHEHAGCILNGEIYISGGYKGPLRGHLDRCWKFSPGSTAGVHGTWTEIASMNKSRSYHTMVTVGEKLLVVGGVKYHYNTDSMEDVRECELYDSAIKQWSFVCNIPHVASCMPHVVLNHKLYIFGGHCFDEDAPQKMHRKLQVLDLATWEWRQSDYTANKVNFFTCDVVEMPRALLSTFKQVERR